MKRFVLISCVSMKLASPAPAEKLYISLLFKLNLAYARSLHPDAIYVLSAKFGLVGLEEVIEPYNQTLNEMRAESRKEWALGVAASLRGKAGASLENDEFTFLAGAHYRSHLVTQMHHVQIPMVGLGIGRQLQFLSQRVGKKALDGA